MTDIKFKKIKSSFNDSAIMNVFSGCVYMPTQEKLNKYADEYMGNESISIFGAFVSGHIAGVIAAEMIQEKMAMCRGIAVDTQYRRRGIGKQLIQYCYKTLNLNELHAETDDDAVEFYINCGFTVEKFFRQSENGEYARYRCIFNNEQHNA